MDFQRMDTCNPDYTFVERLLESAFPTEERRDNSQQRDYTDHLPNFHSYLIRENGENIGLLNLWKLHLLDGEEFTYVEHLATHPLRRNGGWGKKIMEYLKKECGSNLVLEVERPTDELTQRRIGFYERCGLSLYQGDYLQPPYRTGGEFLPMYLMHWGWRDFNHSFQQVSECIHRHVYGVGKDKPQG